MDKIRKIKFDKGYYFGKVYEDYNTFEDWPGWAKYLIDKFEFTSFLDIGCGLGNLTKEIKSQLEEKNNKSLDIQGVDVSDFAIKKAAVSFVTLSDCRKLHFEDKRFDFVFILGTYSYLSTKSDIQKAMQEAYRVSKKLLVFEDVYTWPDKTNDDYDPNRQTVYSQNEWLELWKEVVNSEDTLQVDGDEIILKLG